MAYQSVNSFDNRLIRSFAEITDAELEEKVAAAARCFESWKHASYLERSHVLARAAALLHEQAETFARVMTLEMGKRIGEARGEVEFSSQILAYYAENAERFLAPIKLDPTAGEARMESTPIGVIFGVEPWNYDGQTCCAAKRFIVVDKIADRFLAKFEAALAALEPGDPMDGLTTLGPLSSEAALLDLLKQVGTAVAHGAKVVLGGGRIDRPGAFMQPTILTDVTTTNPAFRDEFFGPVAMFFRVEDEGAAVALANDSDFGLGGSVFTRDIERGRRVASRVDTGMMFVNNLSWSDAELPFGGIKDSGYGRELGDMGHPGFRE